MGLFDKLFGRKKPVAPSAGELARERLTLMLVHDRLKLTPDLLDRIKEELLAVISKYVEIDETGVDVELTHSEHSDKLVARMPVRRQRLHAPSPRTDKASAPLSSHSLLSTTGAKRH